MHKWSPNSAGAMFDSLQRCSRPPKLLNTSIDDPFVRPVRLTTKKERGSTRIWDLGMGTSHHQIARAQCSAPSIAVDDHCLTPTRSYTESGLGSCGSTPPFLLLAFRSAKITCFFDFFDFFDSQSYGKRSINICSFLRHPNISRRSIWSI